MYILITFTISFSLFVVMTRVFVMFAVKSSESVLQHKHTFKNREHLLHIFNSILVKKIVFTSSFSFVLSISYLKEHLHEVMF